MKYFISATVLLSSTFVSAAPVPQPPLPGSFKPTARPPMHFQSDFSKIASETDPAKKAAMEVLSTLPRVGTPGMSVVGNTADSMQRAALLHGDLAAKAAAGRVGFPKARRAEPKVARRSPQPPLPGSFEPTARPPMHFQSDFSKIASETDPAKKAAMEVLSTLPRPIGNPGMGVIKNTPAGMQAAEGFAAKTAMKAKIIPRSEDAEEEPAPPEDKKDEFHSRWVF